MNSLNLATREFESTVIKFHDSDIEHRYMPNYEVRILTEKEVLAERKKELISKLHPILRDI